MKFALIFYPDGEKMRLTGDGEPLLLPVFKWVSRTRDEHGWRVDLAAFCFATTDDFRFQQFEGLVGFGVHRKRPFMHLNIFRRIRIGG